MYYNNKIIKIFLFDKYSIKIKSIGKIDYGVLNTNFKIIDTSGNKYIFRIYNFKNKSQVLFESETLEYLKIKKFPAPKIKRNNKNKNISIFSGKPCLVYDYIEGKNIKVLNKYHLYDIGKILGRLHKLTYRFRSSVEKGTWEPESLKVLVKKNKKKMLNSKLTRAKELFEFIEKELPGYKFPEKLPVGFTHQDVKPENIIFKNGKINGLIDFDNSYIGALLHDITTTIIWGCFKNSCLNNELLKYFLMGYNKERKITALEKKFLYEGIKFRLVREAFIGPYVTMRHQDLIRKRTDYFINLYKKMRHQEKALKN